MDEIVELLQNHGMAIFKDEFIQIDEWLDYHIHS